MIVGKILEYNNAIKSIIDNAGDVSSLAKFKLLGILKQFEPVEKNVEQMRNELIQKYGKAYEDGSFGIKEPKRENFENDEEYDATYTEFEEAFKGYTSELEAILNSESDIKITKFKYDEIIGVGIPADYLVVLYDLIEE